MTFGSTLLFDANFNVAHFLKIIPYAVPLLGMIADYWFTYKEKNIEFTELEDIVSQLDNKTPN